MASQAQFDLIEAYLNHDLSPTDRHSFEQEMGADDALRADMSAYRALRLGLHGLAVEQRIRQAHERYKARPEAADKPDRQPIPLSRVGWGRQAVIRWAAAASVVLALGVGLYVYRQAANGPANGLAYAEQSLQQSPDQLAKSLPAHLAPTERRQLLTAIDQYETGQYDAVIDQLTIPTKDRDTEPYRHYLLGLTYLSSKQPAEAISPLQTAVSTATGALQQKADWFLALAYLKNEQPDLAHPILTRIRLDNAHPYQSLAEKLMKAKAAVGTDHE